MFVNHPIFEKIPILPKFTKNQLLNSVNVHQREFFQNLFIFVTMLRNGLIVLRSVSRARFCSPKPLIRFLPASNFIHRQYSSAPDVEKYEFQAETKSLLDIVAKSLYSEQEVINFL